MEKEQKIGFGLIAISVVLMIIGSIGYTVEGDVNDVPTPNVPDFVFFSDEALPSNPAGLFFNADAHITWDREDIFVVISDVSTKKECDSTPAGLGGFGSTNCNSANIDSVAGSANDNNVDGIKWNVESGEYYVGIGSKDSALIQGVDINVHYKVDIGFSFVSYLVCTLIAVTGLAYARFS